MRRDADLDSGAALGASWCDQPRCERPSEGRSLPRAFRFPVPGSPFPIPDGQSSPNPPAENPVSANEELK